MWFPLRCLKDKKNNSIELYELEVVKCFHIYICLELSYKWTQMILKQNKSS